MDAAHRREQDGNSDDSGHEAADHETARPPAAQDGVEDGQPDRHGRHQHGRDAGRNIELGKHHATIPTQQE